jgi:hypothetical protein
MGTQPLPMYLPSKQNNTSFTATTKTKGNQCETTTTNGVDKQPAKIYRKTCSFQSNATQKKRMQYHEKFVHHAQYNNNAWRWR